MNIHETLKQALTEAATALAVTHGGAVPLFWEGTVYTPPMAPHTVGNIVIESAAAATLGKNGLTRTDGALMVKCVAVSGTGDTEAVALSRNLSRLFPRGRSFELDGGEPSLTKDGGEPSLTKDGGEPSLTKGGGELTLTTPVAGTPTSDGRRLTVPLKIPFYALTQEG